MNQKILAGIDSSGNELYKIHLGSDKKFKFDDSGISLESSGTGTGEYAIDTWYHIEINKDSTDGKYYFYVDGNYISSGVSTTNISGVTSLTLSTPTGGINGYLDEIRILKGFVLHNTTSNFTPSTEAYSDPTEASSFVINLGTTVGNHIVSYGNKSVLIKDNTSIEVEDTLESSSISIKTDDIDKMKIDPNVVNFMGNNKINGNLNFETANKVLLDKTGDIYLSDRLGIGITNPDSGLHLDGSSTNSGIIHIGKEYSSTPNAPSAGQGMRIYVKDDGLLHINSNTANDITLGKELSNITINNTKMLVNYTGIDAFSMFNINDLIKVILNSEGIGIGTTNPIDKLHVSSLIQSNQMLINKSSGIEKLEIDGALKIGDSVFDSSVNGVLRYKNGELYGKRNNEWNILTNTGNGIPNYVNKKAIFNNNEVTISNIGNGSNQITVSDASFFSPGSIVYITETTDLSLDRRYHNITGIIGNNIYIETNSSKVVSTGKLRSNYTDFTDNMITNNNEIVLLPLSHSLTTGDHHIYINWTSKFNENPLSDQILKIYYKNGQFTSPPPPGTSILGGSNAEGELLSTIFLSNLVSDTNTSSTSVFVRVPEGETHYLRWTRSSTEQFRWGNDVGELILDNFDVNYTTTSAFSAFTDRIYKGSSSLKVIDNGSGTGEIKMKIVGNNRATLNSNGLSIGTDSVNNLLNLQDTNDSFMSFNTTNNNGHSGILLKSNQGIDNAIFIDDGDSQKLKISFDVQVVTIIVTVVSGKFVLNGDQINTPNFVTGNTYIFDQSDSSNSNHPLKFSTNSSSFVEYTSVSNGTAGNSGATVTINPTSPATIYLYCLYHGFGMGSIYNDISINSKNTNLETQSSRESNSKFSISQAGVVNSKNAIPFTGSHLCITKQQYENLTDDNLRNNIDLYKEKIGYIVSSTGIIYNLDKSSDNLISESLPVIKFSNKENDSSIYGIIASTQNIII